MLGFSNIEASQTTGKRLNWINHTIDPNRLYFLLKNIYI